MAKANPVVIAKKDIKPSESPYVQMIMEAVSTLKDSNGSSQPAIAKAVEERHKEQLPPSFKKSLPAQLKRLVETKRLIKVKNTYKLGADPPKKPSKGAKKMKRLSQVKTPEGLKDRSSVAKRKTSKPIRFIHA